MNHQARIAKAFAANDIRRVLVIDDAYDPPDLNEEILAALLDFLDGAENRKRLVAEGLSQDSVDAAKQAATDGEEEIPELREVYQVLYRAFAEERSGFDPGGYFRARRGAALEALRPLRVLLHECGENVEVVSVGPADGLLHYRENRPQVLFLDYYLADDVEGVGDVGEVALSRGRRASLEFLKDVVQTTTEEHEYPAVVLMSSRDIVDGDDFRRDAAGEKIMRLRFRLLSKKGMHIDGDSIAIDHAAADALLDTFQGFRFGQSFQESLSTWREGVYAALKEFEHEVRRWDRKDIAYLSRFRLRDEGQPVSEYLAWLFGGYFGALIERHVDWGHAAFGRLDTNGGAGGDIDGAPEGPTIGVAKCFHEVRVRTKGVESKRRNRLGDLYRESGGKNGVWVVLTPDCDLVERRGKMKAVNILAMGGILRKFDEEGAAVDNFVLIDDKPYGVQWNPKDLQTFPLRGDGSLRDGGAYKFLGTLRGLYAQGIQRRALADLWRVGIPVAPALGIRAGVTVWMRAKGGQFKKVEVTADAKAVLLPRREGQAAAGRVLLERRFVWALVERLRDQDREGLAKEDGEALGRVLAKEDEFCGWILTSGGVTKDVDKFGVSFVIGSGPRRGKKGSWLQIVASVPDDALDRE